MAYPIKLFDFQTEEGRLQATTFLQNLDKTLTDLFGIVQPTDKLKKYHKFTDENLPQFLKDLGTRGVKEIVKELPGGTLKWRGTLGVYGRKAGSVIKKNKGIVYRMIVHIGETEVYYFDGEGLNNEPTVLPNCFALLCSPVMIDKINIKVRSEPIRKGMEPKLAELVPKIRSRKYMRATIVLDLPLEGLEFGENKDKSGKNKDKSGEHKDSCQCCSN